LSSTSEAEGDERARANDCGEPAQPDGKADWAEGADQQGPAGVAELAPDLACAHRLAEPTGRRRGGEGGETHRRGDPNPGSHEERGRDESDRTVEGSRGCEAERADAKAAAAGPGVDAGVVQGAPDSGLNNRRAAGEKGDSGAGREGAEPGPATDHR
jgi:hypothetical protein